jgi:hypothetical protein
MFLTSDTFADRQTRIRSFDNNDIFIGVLLATMDFEWTVRRAIIALGYQKNSTIRSQVLANCTGIERYKDAWKQQVTPRYGVALPSIFADWEFLKSQAFPLRHRLVHGAKATTGVQYARDRRDCLLNASGAVIAFADSKKVNLYARLPVRSKDLVLSQ